MPDRTLTRRPRIVSGFIGSRRLDQEDINALNSSPDRLFQLIAPGLRDLVYQGPGEVLNHVVQAWSASEDEIQNWFLDVGSGGVRPTTEQEIQALRHFNSTANNVLLTYTVTAEGIVMGSSCPTQPENVTEPADPTPVFPFEEV